MRRAAWLPIFLLLALCACVPAPGPGPTLAPTPTPTPVAKSPWMEDYDLFWSTLEENYPQMSVAGRITGQDFAQIKEKYRPTAEKASSPEELLRVLGGLAKEFRGTGHLAIYDAGLYAYHYERLNGSDDVKSQYAADRMNNPQSRALYGYAPPPEETPAQQDTPPADAPAPPAENLTFRRYPEDGAAYVEVRSMAPADWAGDQAALLDFFQAIEAEGYDHCIVDIRYNGGGSSNYGTQLIALPNVTGPMGQEHYALVKSGDEIQDYFGLVSQWWPLHPIGTLPVERLPRLNPADLEGITHYCVLDVGLGEGYTFPEIPAFSGKFWLLVGPGVYSASEYFAIFCKDTGFATLVGETTGGDGVGINPLVCVLPNSGVAYRFSAENGLNADGSCNEEMGTVPDIPIQKGEDALSVCIGEIRRAAAQ